MSPAKQDARDAFNRRIISAVAELFNRHHDHANDRRYTAADRNAFFHRTFAADAKLREGFRDARDR